MVILRMIEKISINKQFQDKKPTIIIIIITFFSNVKEEINGNAFRNSRRILRLNLTNLIDNTRRHLIKSLIFVEIKLLKVRFTKKYFGNILGRIEKEKFSGI